MLSISHFISFGWWKCPNLCRALWTKHGKTTISIIIKFLRRKWQVLWSFEFRTHNHITYVHSCSLLFFIAFYFWGEFIPFLFHSICNYKANCFNIIILSFLRATQLIIHNFLELLRREAVKHRVSPSYILVLALTVFFTFRFSVLPESISHKSIFFSSQQSLSLWLRDWMYIFPSNAYEMKLWI